MTPMRNLAVGDRVRLLRGTPNAGTVVRIVGHVPQVVVVSWDRVTAPFHLTTVPASRLQQLPEEENPQV